MPDNDKPRVAGERLAAAGKFVALKFLDWIDARGVARSWESAERVADAGAVLIIPRFKASGKVLLIRQYRPPARSAVIEFPAGLINPGEKPENAAVRELREETGFNASVVDVFPSAYTSPGLSNETVFVVTAEIDESAPGNANPQTEFDPSEQIENILIPEKELHGFYEAECRKGTAFDAKLAAYIVGLRRGV